MILDTLKNGAVYNSMNPRFAKVFAYLQNVNLETIEEGKYEIDGKEIFMNVMDRDLKSPDVAALEVHDKYIDIQIVVNGHEGFGWKDRKACSAPRGEMNADKDILFFEDKPTTYFTLLPGEIAIFFPQDGHAPLVGDGHVKKVVVKVLV